MNQFSIREIELLTGIKAHTLRIWEQRYNLPLPKRTETNIRYYEEADLKLLLNIAMLSRHGYKISQISRLNEEEIRKLAIEYSMRSEKHSVHIQTLIGAMLALDETVFEKTLSKSILQHGLEKTMMELIFPLMKLIGMMWQTGTINPAYEHFISNIIRQKILVAVDGQHIKNHPEQKKFLLFLPEGETHELGLLFANYMIRVAGHHTLYLGCNLPVKELSQISDSYLPDFIFTSITTGYPQMLAKGLLSEIQNNFSYAKFLVTGRFFMDHPNLTIPNLSIISLPEDLKKHF